MISLFYGSALIKVRHISDLCQRSVSYTHLDVYKRQILILAIVGAMIASWMAAGTIPSLMYYGINVISPKVFLLTACILCSIVCLLYTSRCV